MNHLKRDNQKGFTIVELVVVIIILGILAATALPRFLDVSDEAHVSAVQGVAGALAAGLELRKAYYIANSKPSSATIDGVGVTFGNALGYPTDTCADLWGETLSQAPALAASQNFTDEADWHYNGSGTDLYTGAGCIYSYDGVGSGTDDTVVVSSGAATLVTTTFN